MIKAEQMILPFSKLLENGQDSEKTINMKKFHIFRSFSVVYYLPHSDKFCRNYVENTFLAIFKIDLKAYRIVRNNIYQKVSHLFKLFNAMSYAAFGHTVKKLYQKYELGGTCTVF